MSSTDYDNTSIEVRSSLVIDDSSTAKIDKQNLHITAGRPVPSSLKFQVLETVKAVLTKSGTPLKTHYADQFTQTELVRFKYILINKLSEGESEFILKMLYEKLKEKFNIKQLTYLVPPNDKSFILIWM